MLLGNIKNTGVTHDGRHLQQFCFILVQVTGINQTRKHLSACTHSFGKVEELFTEMGVNFERL
jgi:hypothetical protein